MSESERVTITLPRAVADSLRRRVASGDAESTSGYVAGVLEERFREENLESVLADMAARGGPVDDEARARSAELMRWARGG